MLSEPFFDAVQRFGLGMAKGAFQFGGLWVALAVCTSRWSDSRRVIEAMIASQRIPMAIRKDTLDQLLEGAIRRRFSIRTTYSTS
jgi:hypothetical protein